MNLLYCVDPPPENNALFRMFIIGINITIMNTILSLTLTKSNEHAYDSFITDKIKLYTHEK
jgi:hypothetical protein